MELPKKLLEQIAFNARIQIEKNKFVVTDETIHEGNLLPARQTIDKQIKIDITFLFAYN